MKKLTKKNKLQSKVALLLPTKGLPQLLSSPAIPLETSVPYSPTYFKYRFKETKLNSLLIMKKIDAKMLTTIKAGELTVGRGFGVSNTGTNVFSSAPFDSLKV